MTTADLLRAALDAQHVTDPQTRAGLAAVCMGESNMMGHVETGYAHTANARIRQVFGGRVEDLSDEQLDALKADDRTWFNFIYDGANDVGRQLGNRPGTDDGYNFRGRGLVQLTGRANYTRYCGKIGRPDILDNPDLANDPAIAAQLAVAYILDRYHGGGFEALMQAVGNNTPDIAATKRRYYQQFLASGEFAARGTISPDELNTGTISPAPQSKIPDARSLQAALIAEGLDPGPADGIWGPRSQAALAAHYQRVA